MSKAKNQKFEQQQAAKARLAAIAAEERKSKRNQTFIAVGVGGLVVALVVATVVAVMGSRWPIPELQEVPAPLAEVARPTTSDVHDIAGVELTGGIPVGVDGVAGTVTEGVPVVEVFADHMCGYCQIFANLQPGEGGNGELEQLRAEGKITLVYVPLSIMDRASQGTVFSTRAAAAVALIADRSPEHFLAFNAKLFEQLPSGRGLSDQQMVDFAVELGVPAEIAEEIKEWKFVPFIEATAVASFERGVATTPSVLIDGQPATEGGWPVPGMLTADVAAAQEVRDQASAGDQ